MAANLHKLVPSSTACACSSSSSSSNSSSNPTESMLQESIKLFISQYESGISDFSHFGLMFSRIINTMPSPPIEVIWFYTAVNFHSHSLTLSLQEKDGELGRVLALNDLFHLLVSCSGSGPCSSSLKKIAVLAPLIYHLYNLISDSRLCKKFTVEIGCLLERLVSFISMCCCEPDHHDPTLAFSPCFLGLVNVWMVQNSHSHSASTSQLLNLFFPIVSDEIRNGLWTATVGVLAGIVMCQAFLLYLCFKFGSGFDQLQDVTNLAVHTISTFRSCYFFDAILRMLLEPRLPVTTLLNVGDEARLQEAMFDAIILVDYPFYNPACEHCSRSHHLNKFATTWLFVVDKTIQFVRHNGDQMKQISYMKAFCNSPILSQLLKWVSTQIVMLEATKRTNLSTPTAFMHWLVHLTSQASIGFNEEFTAFCEKAVNYLSELKSTLMYLDERDNNFNVDQSVGEDIRADEDLEMIESIDDTEDDCRFNFTAIDTCRKRKEEKGEDGLRVKLLKYQITGSPIKIISPFQNEVGLIKRTYEAD